MAQHHDHMGRLSMKKIKAYDDAGYNAVVCLDYAGKKSPGRGGYIYCDYRLWPAHKYLSGFESDQQALASLRNIKLFIPAMEEIGSHHMTSPFLTRYIGLWEADYYQKKETWHYENTQQCIDLINRFGGMAILCHPVSEPDVYMKLDGYKGIEIINGYFYRKWVQKDKFPDERDNLKHFQRVWDHLLTHKSTKIWGFAVNDHFPPPGDKPFLDSGKIIVMLPSYSLKDYRNSLEKGSFFAIHDRGDGKEKKNKYPKIASIKTTNRSIAIDTKGKVKWVANGENIAKGNTIELGKLPLHKGYKYVRAEIVNDYGTVYTQPWTLHFQQK